LRVTWHQEDGLVVLSMWRENLCTGSFRLPIEAVPDLIDLLRAGLDDAWRQTSQRAPLGGSADVPPAAETA